MFNFCDDVGDERTLGREGLSVIHRSPMRRMPPPKLDDRPIPLLSAEQIEALWNLTERPGRDFRRRRDSAIIRLFLATGVRVGEMAGLHKDDFDLRGRSSPSGQGRKWRRVPYSGGGRDLTRPLPRRQEREPLGLSDRASVARDQGPHDRVRYPGRGRAHGRSSRCSRSPPPPAPAPSSTAASSTA